MDDILIITHETPKLRTPVFVEGLPGVGNVGKLAAEHLVDELKAKKFITIQSKYFPPQVLVSDEGLVRLVDNALYYLKRKGKPDIILMTGDYQGLSPEGQYELAYRTLDLLTKYKVSRIYTLGGYGLGRIVEQPRVLGAATSKELIEEMKTRGVVFSKGEPGSGIIGASGLLLGLAPFFGMNGVCLMGETSGYFVDPKSARRVLELLSSILGLKLDYAALEQKAQQIERLTAQFKEAEKAVAEAKADDLRYIG